MLPPAAARLSLAALAFLLAAPPRPTLGAASVVPVPVPAPAATAVAPEPPPRPAIPAHRTQIAVPENNPLEIYPPRTPAAAPLTLALHGKDMDPLDLCDAWNDVGRARGWLVCPAGNAPGEDAFDWGGPTEDRVAALDAQLEAVDEVYGPLVDHGAGDVIVGFSRGAFLARDLVYARPGRFRALVLLGAAVRLDAARLRAAGVRRVLLAAGDRDDARRTMIHTADRLAARGVAARFVGLGDIAHALPPDLGRVMQGALAWVHEDG